MDNEEMELFDLTTWKQRLGFIFYGICAVVSVYLLFIAILSRVVR